MYTHSINNVYPMRLADFNSISMLIRHTASSNYRGY